MRGRRRVTILGATGTVGDNALALLAQHEAVFEIVALTANRNVEKLVGLAKKFRPDYVAIADASLTEALGDALAAAGVSCDYGGGADAVIAAAQRDADIVVAAIVGFAGFDAAYAALAQGARLALANKESLVAAGGFFMQSAARYGAELLPVDSEHNAIFQILTKDVEKIVLTASGGPFHDLAVAAFDSITPQMAVRHPNWSMGAKISVDSASLMNKGLEVIEAAHLFGVAATQIDVLVHRQSLVHGLVHFADGSVVAQMGVPDMRTPLAVCLFWPERQSAGVDALDLAAIGRLDFARPDREKFPCLSLAEAALRAGDGATNALNAANEVAVEAFLAEQISFIKIPQLVESVLEEAVAMPDRFALDNVAGIHECNAHYRARAETLIKEGVV